MAHVDLWLRDLDCSDDDHARLAELLSEAEQSRARRLIRPIDRRRFETRRGLLREILAEHSGCPVHLLAFRETDHGKPYLCAGSCTLEFNLSHSCGAMLVGVSSEAAVGVDIEAVTRLHEDIGLVAFTPGEQQSLADLPPAMRDAYALRLWTCKEAVLKAAGTGLLLPPSRIEISFIGDSAYGHVIWLGDVALQDRHVRNVYSFPPRDGFVAAVATTSGVHSMTLTTRT